MLLENYLKIDTKKTRQSFAWSYVLVFGFFYIIIPLFFMKETTYPDITYQLAGATFLSIIGFYIGIKVDLFPNLHKKFISINVESFSKWIFLFYILTVALIIGTAGTIPLVASLSGTSQAELFILREGFLKERKGLESLLSYMITLVDTTFFPMVILYAIIFKRKVRIIYLAVFFLYSISFLEKGYFLKIGIPLFFYYYYTSKNKKTYLIVSGAVLFMLISLMFLLSKFDSSEVVRDEPFFSILYTPTTIFQAIVWRMVAVPVITAYEGFALFIGDVFKGKLLYGATSSFISSIFGLERVNFERELYQSQFGGSETGNANQFYVVEAFVNFGYAGVIFFSYIFGKIVRDLINTRNIAIICIIPVLYYNLFSSGLIGNLLSNGFLLFYIFTINLRLNKKLDINTHFILNEKIK